MKQSNRKISLTPFQEKFVRENYKTMKRKDMLRTLGITVGKLSCNMQIMEGIELRPRRANIERQPKDPDNFDVDLYSNWLLGTKYDI